MFAAFYEMHVNKKKLLCVCGMIDEFYKNDNDRIFQHSPMKTSFACSNRSFVSWSLVLTVTNSICWRCKMTLSSPRTTFSVGLGHNKRVFPPQCAVQVANDVLEDLTARLSHRFATHAHDHGLWNVLRSVKITRNSTIHNNTLRSNYFFFLYVI